MCNKRHGDSVKKSISKIEVHLFHDRIALKTEPAPF